MMTNEQRMLDYMVSEGYVPKKESNQRIHFTSKTSELTQAKMAVRLSEIHNISLEETRAFLTQFADRILLEEQEKKKNRRRSDTDNFKSLEASLPPTYFCQGKFIFKATKINGESVWQEYTSEAMRRYLIDYGFNSNSESPSEVSRMLHKIESTRVVDDIKDLGGYTEGIHTIGGKVVLVKSTTKIPEPVKGDHSLIDELLFQMFGIGQVHQFEWWLKHTYQGFHNDTWQRGQALFLVGPVKSCKTLLLEIIAAILGDRMTDPTQAWTGETSFNAELFRATLLAVDDRRLSDPKIRNRFAASLKNWIASLVNNCHEKGMTPQTYEPRSRVIICLNDDAWSLKTLPLMVNSIKDKVSLFAVEKPDMREQISQDVIRNYPALKDTFLAQVPAYLDYLLNEVEIPETQVDERFGTISYHDATLLSKIESDPKVLQLFEYIDMTLTDDFDGTAAELTEFLHKPTTKEDYQKNTTFKMDAMHIGFTLASAMEDLRFCTRVKRREHYGLTRWQITCNKASPKKLMVEDGKVFG